MQVSSSGLRLAVALAISAGLAGAAQAAGAKCAVHDDNFVVRLPQLTGGNVPYNDSCGNPHHVAGTVDVGINSMCITYLEPAESVVAAWDCGGTPGMDPTTKLYHRTPSGVDIHHIKMSCFEIQGRSDRRDLSCPEP